MNEHIVTLSKRRSQLKQAITKMVQEAYELVEKTPDLDTKLKLIETLRTVTTGKVRIIIIKENLLILNYLFKDFC
jgi:26S proteasome regulatory subunit N5